MNILEKIVTIGFPPNQYIREEFDKFQIVLHNTVSGRGVKGDVNWWLIDPRRISTCIIVGHYGVPYQMFSSRFCAYHIGVKGRFDLEKHSIGIEIDSWGPLYKTKKGAFYPVRYTKKGYQPDTTRSSVIPEDVIEYADGYRGIQYYEKYTQQQIETVVELARYWAKKYKISIAYNRDMWDVSERALAGAEGVWSHTSFRKNKSDIHPYPPLIEALKSL